MIYIFVLIALFFVSFDQLYFQKNFICFILLSLLKLRKINVKISSFTFLVVKNIKVYQVKILEMHERHLALQLNALKIIQYLYRNIHLVFSINKMYLHRYRCSYYYKCLYRYHKNYCIRYLLHCQNIRYYSLSDNPNQSRHHRFSYIRKFFAAAL